VLGLTPHVFLSRRYPRCWEALPNLTNTGTRARTKPLTRYSGLFRQSKQATPGLRVNFGVRLTLMQTSRRARVFGLQRLRRLAVRCGLMSVSSIEKDLKRFPKTHGWAYARSDYDPATHTFKPSVIGTECGYACHTTVAANDYIFTAYPDW
jgi:hypothetical protein